MSDYCRQLVLRYPITKEDRERIETIIDNKKIGYQYKDGYFEICCAESVTENYDYRYFLDYVVYSTYGEEYGDFGKIRPLHQSEVEEFKPLFELVIPNIDMAKVKVVDYCWYNCSEPPAYYDEIDDPFLKPLSMPQAFWKSDTSEPVMTTGGDSFVICSRCGGGEHLSGIEHPNFIERCPDCGAKMTRK